jgi:hypothetical protein
VLSTEVLNLINKLIIYLIQNDEHWYPGHINVEVAEIYDNCCKNNLTVAKNYVLKKSLVYFLLTTRVFFIQANYLKEVRNAVCAKGQVTSIVLKMFLQFDSEYWIFPVECMPIYGTRHLYRYKEK